MRRLQTEHYSAFYSDQLVNFFHLPIRLSQWSCTAPFPLQPYQRIASYHRSKYFRAIIILRRCFAALLFSVILSVPIFIYYVNAGEMTVFKIPLSIKLLFYLQALLQAGSLGYTLFVYQFRTSFHRFYFDRFVHVLERFGRPDISNSLSDARTNFNRFLIASLLLTLLVIGGILLNGHSWGNLLKIVVFIITQLMATSLTLQYQAVLTVVAVLLRQMNDTVEIMLYGTVERDQYHRGSRSHFRPTMRFTGDDEQTIEKIRLLQLQLLQIVFHTNGGEVGRMLIVVLLTIFIFLNTELLQLYQGVKARAFTFDVIGIKLTNSMLKIVMLLIFAISNRSIQKQNLRGVTLLFQMRSAPNSARCREITNRFITQTTLFLANGHEAYGMVSFDMTLVLSIVAGLTNILVILIQFSDAKTSCN
uniref:Gustatory receptor n=1 Tax=Anopheles epiroticus TaxID=199890 RepID=A0A182PZ75_9DIPT